MAPQRGSFAIALGAGAALVLGGLAFVPSLGALRGGTVRARAWGAGARGAQAGGPGASTAGANLAALPTLALCALAAGVGLRRHPARRAAGVAARARVTTVDEYGRFRFAAPMKPMVPAEQPGATAPLGFFDPLGFSKNPLMTFAEDPNGFRHLRSAEIKHGRVAMMASIGSLVAHYVKLPGFEGVPTGMAALNTSQGASGFAAVVIFAGLVEALQWNQSREPGNYGDPFNFGNYTLDWRNRELNNGRLGMFAVMGQFAAEAVTGKDPAVQLGF